MYVVETVQFVYRYAYVICINIILKIYKLFNHVYKLLEWLCLSNFLDCNNQEEYWTGIPSIISNIFCCKQHKRIALN